METLGINGLDAPCGPEEGPGATTERSGRDKRDAEV